MEARHVEDSDMINERVGLCVDVRTHSDHAFMVGVKCALKKSTATKAALGEHDVGPFWNKLKDENSLNRD